MEQTVSPLLLQIIDRICKRYEARGSLSGIMKLGQEFEPEERASLEAFLALFR